MWKTHFIVLSVTVIRPQALWKTCGKKLFLWKKKTKYQKTLISTGQNYRKLWKCGKLLSNHRVLLQ